MGTSEANTRRRVKLYMLNDDRQWDDKGTGHVSALHTEQNSMALVVISENDGSCLLESKIQPDTAYQKQQETLIVWSEGESVDLALSFQEKVGCDDIWEKICNVQGIDPSVDITQEIIDEDPNDTEEPTNQPDPGRNVELPPCDLAHLEEIRDMLNQVANNMIKRDCLAQVLECSTFLKQLVDVFHKAEDLEKLDSLHCLYDIMRTIISLNRHALYEIIFADDMLLDVIGMLEYNPAGRTHHRDFVLNKAHFKEVLPLHSPELISKIHQTYRVQYIQDCCLPPPSLFDENVLSTLTSFVFFNKVDIITSLQDDEKFMKHLFTQLRDEEIDDSKRKDLALFMKEFCSISMSLQATQKENFFASLSRHGALRAVEVLLVIDDRSIKTAALDILNTFIEQQPSLVREFISREAQETRDDDKLLINIMVDQLISDTDPELGNAILLVSMLKSLIDPDNMMPNTGGFRTEKTEFLTFFYRRCIGTITAPLFENTIADRLNRDDYRTALVLSHLLELLTFCIENHTYHMKNYVFNKDLVKRVLILLKSEHKFLILSSLRLMRRLINMKEEFYNRYLIKNNLFKPVIDLFKLNGNRYNMIDSAIIELFEYIRTENIPNLVTHVIQNHWNDLREKNYVKTFNGLRLRYEQTMDRSIHTENVTSGVINPNHFANRFRRDARAMDEEEEEWFEQMGDDDDSPPASLSLGASSGASIVDNSNDFSPLGSRDRFLERCSKRQAPSPCDNATNDDIDFDFTKRYRPGRVGRIRAINIQTPQLSHLTADDSFSSGEESDEDTTDSKTPISPSQDCDNSVNQNFIASTSSNSTDNVAADVSSSSSSNNESLSDSISSPASVNEESSVVVLSDTQVNHPENNADDAESIGPLSGLVDYSDEDSDGEDEEPATKRARLP